MKRPIPAEASPGVNRPFPDEAWVKRYPVLCEYLGDEFWDDAKPREVATIVIKAQDGMICAALNDKESKASLYVTGECVQKALDAMERALKGMSPDWRKWVGVSKKKG